MPYEQQHFTLVACVKGHEQFPYVFYWSIGKSIVEYFPRSVCDRMNVWLYTAVTFVWQVRLIVPVPPAHELTPGPQLVSSSQPGVYCMSVFTCLCWVLWLNDTELYEEMWISLFADVKWLKIVLVFTNQKTISCQYHTLITGFLRYCALTAVVFFPQ